MDDAIPTPASLDRRVTKLEWVVPGQVAKLETTITRLDKVADAQLVDHAAQKSLTKDVSILTTKLDRLTWAIVGLALTIAASAITLAISIAGGAG